MRIETLLAKTLPLGAALLLTVVTPAKADPLPGAAVEDTIDLSVTGETKVNGSLFQEGMQEKPVEVFGEVVKVIDGPEGAAVLYVRPVKGRKTGRNGNVEEFNMAAEPRPFVSDPEWKMFDAEGNPTDNPRFAMKVVMPYAADINAAIADVIWNECVGPVTGNYTGLPCNKRRGLSDDYMAYLKTNFLACVNKGLAVAGLPAATAAHIVHDGTMADARHNRGSLHAAGRAIDVQKIITTNDDGSKSVFDFLKTNTDHRVSSSCQPSTQTNCKFYTAFRRCWADKQNARRCPQTRNGLTGTIGWEDRNHVNHHLHTSMPFCPNSNGYFITESQGK